MSFHSPQNLGIRDLNHGYVIQFPLRQEEIADTLGLTTIHVNRTLHALREKGVFKIHNHELTILDYDAIRNAHGINLATGEGLMLVFKAQQQAHSRLRNCCCNEEDEYKDKLVVEVISCVFLSTIVGPELESMRSCDILIDA